MNNYIDILSDSLSKKIEILKSIQEYNENQRSIFSEDDVDMNLFDEAIKEKDTLIEKLIHLDDGFEILYRNVAEELQTNRSMYATQIRKMQDKIAIITELSASIRAEEIRNKKIIEDYFTKQKQSIGKGRNSSRAAYGYYKNYSGGDISLSIFDEKH